MSHPTMQFGGSACFLPASFLFSQITYSCPSTLEEADCSPQQVLSCLKPVSPFFWSPGHCRVQGWWSWTFWVQRILGFSSAMLRQHRLSHSLVVMVGHMVLIAPSRHSAVLLEERLKMKQISQKAEQKERVTPKSGNHGAHQPPDFQLLRLLNPLCCLCFLGLQHKVPTHSNIKEKIRMEWYQTAKGMYTSWEKFAHD